MSGGSISHSLYGGLEGLDDNLMPRQGMMPRTIGKTDSPNGTAEAYLFVADAAFKFCSSAVFGRTVGTWKWDNGVQSSVCGPFITIRTTNSLLSSAMLNKSVTSELAS